MGHCIHAIVAPAATANAISVLWPALPRLDRGDGFAIFPVDAGLIDARIAPDKTPLESRDESMMLTGGFRKLLQTMSRDGQLAYIETEYFGGVGGQGALVCRNGEEVMAPRWHGHGTINKALRLIGMPRRLFQDHFAAAGFDQVRDNDDILSLIAAEQDRKHKDHAD
jgi:hypothetical protein